MTNPNDSVGTNGAYGGRTSVNALNDVLASFTGRGVLSGWAVAASSGMTVSVGGSAGVRDVAIAEDNAGNRTTVDNRSSSPISVTLSAASSSSTRIDCIVAYVNNPATVLVTTIDNPSTCGIIAVQGTTSAPDESAIRSAITADGGTGSTAYYVVLATITIPAGTTDLTDTNIAQGAVVSPNIGFEVSGALPTASTSLANNNSYMVTSGSHKVLYINCKPQTALTAERFYELHTTNVTPSKGVSITAPTIGSNNGVTIELTTAGVVRCYVHGSGTYGNWVRAVLPVFTS